MKEFTAFLEYILFGGVIYIYFLNSGGFLGYISAITCNPVAILIVFSNVCYEGCLLLVWEFIIGGILLIGTLFLVSSISDASVTVDFLLKLGFL